MALSRLCHGSHCTCNGKLLHYFLLALVSLLIISKFARKCAICGPSIFFLSLSHSFSTLFPGKTSFVTSFPDLALIYPQKCTCLARYYRLFIRTTYVQGAERKWWIRSQISYGGDVQCLMATLQELWKGLYIVDYSFLFKSLKNFIKSLQIIKNCWKLNINFLVQFCKPYIQNYTCKPHDVKGWKDIFSFF